MLSTILTKRLLARITSWIPIVLVQKISGWRSIQMRQIRQLHVPYNIIQNLRRGSIVLASILLAYHRISLWISALTIREGLQIEKK